MYKATITLTVQSDENHNLLVNGTGIGTTEQGAVAAASHNVTEKANKLKGQLRMEGFQGRWKHVFESLSDPSVIAVTA